MSEIVKAPFTREQVMALNKFQELAFVHPFTCANESNDVLVATVRGWICPFCDYTQDWFHSVMIKLPMYLPDEFRRDINEVMVAMFGSAGET